jgi:hypothetical protein
MAMTKIVDWDQLYPGRFWKAGLLAPDEKKILTVSEVRVEPLETEKGIKEKGVLTFEGEKLQMPLNKTNGVCLREMFGRVPYKWVGHRFAIFQGVWANEPCIRIWGSPELTEDKPVTIELPKKKPFVLVMHAMGGAQRQAAQRPADEAPPAPRCTPRCTEVLQLMAAATTLEDLDDVAADIATEQFNDRETALLDRAHARRLKQIKDKEAEQHAQQTDNVIR